MKSKTVLYCFGLLSAISLGCFAAESLLTSLIGIEPSPIHNVLPVTTMPLWVKHFSRDNFAEKVAEKVEKLDRKSARAMEKKKEELTVFLKTGSKIVGTLISEDENWVTLRIDGSDVGFQHSEILEIVRTPPQGATAEKS